MAAKGQYPAHIKLFKKLVRDNHINWHMRYWAILHMDDKEELATVANNDDHPVIRKEAVRKLDDQGLLFDIALNDQKEEVRREAINRIFDMKFLLKLRIAMEANYQQQIMERLRLMRT